MFPPNQSAPSSMKAPVIISETENQFGAVWADPSGKIVVNWGTVCHYMEPEEFEDFVKMVQGASIKRQNLSALQGRIVQFPNT